MIGSKELYECTASYHGTTLRRYSISCDLSDRPKEVVSASTNVDLRKEIGSKPLRGMKGSNDTRESENTEELKQEVNIKFNRVQNHSIKEKENICDNSNIPESSKNKKLFKESDLKMIKASYITDVPHSKFFNKLNKEISAEVITCDKYINEIKPYCELLRNNMENLARDLFNNSNNISVHIYGSMATELALPDSDLDMLICGVPSNSKEDLIQLMNKLSDKLSVIEYIVHQQCITTARVPVIKLVVDLIKLSSNQIEIEHKSLHVDIVFDDTINSVTPIPYPLLCAKIIKYRSSSIPYFRPLSILIKKLIREAGLNKPFLGDISSYALNLLISSFLNMCRNSPSPAESFFEVLRYYGKEFDNTKMMIVQGNFAMYMPIGLPKGAVVVTDVVKYWLNIAGNVIRFDKLKKFLFKCWEELTKMMNEGKEDDILKELLYKCNGSN